MLTGMSQRNRFIAKFKAKKIRRTLLITYTRIVVNRLSAQNERKKPETILH